MIGASGDDLTKRRSGHICTCGEPFSKPVWHCGTPGRDHHWLMSRHYCANCRANRVVNKPTTRKGFFTFAEYLPRTPHPETAGAGQ
jgi:hypothetical protein